MSAPDFITTIYTPDGVQVVLPVDAPAREYEVAYVRRDPAVLAELPEVKALISARVAELEAELETLTANKNAAHHWRRENLARAEAAEAREAKLVEAAKAVSGYGTMRWKEWEKQFPELSAAILAESRKYDQDLALVLSAYMAAALAAWEAVHDPA